MPDLAHCGEGTVLRQVARPFQVLLQCAKAVLRKRIHIISRRVTCGLTRVVLG